MDIKLELILSQMKELQRYADELIEIRLSLKRHKESLNDAWVSDETGEINEVMEELERQTTRTIDELCRIGSDLIKAYEEIL